MVMIINIHSLLGVESSRLLFMIMKAMHCSKAQPEGPERAEISARLHLPQPWAQRKKAFCSLYRGSPSCAQAHLALGLLLVGERSPHLVGLSSVRQQHLEAHPAPKGPERVGTHRAAGRPE